MIDVQFTPEFKRNLRTLAKKYRHIRDDVDPVIEALQAGEILGDQIPGVGLRFSKYVFRIRIAPEAKAADIVSSTTCEPRLTLLW